MAAVCRESPLGSGRAQPWLPEVASVNLLLAVAGDGVELRAAPVCGPVSTALGIGEYQFAAVAAGAWTSCRGWVLMASPLASWEEGGGGTGPVRLDSHPRRMWCDLPRVHGTGGREQSGARSQPAGASLDIGKQRSPIKRRLLCRLRRSHYTRRTAGARYRPDLNRSSKLVRFASSSAS